MKDVKIALLAFLLNLTTGLQAQKLNYVQYTTDDGLPSSDTYAVIQDSLGYIWVATDNGVSRFDGYKFKNFSTEDGLVDKVVLKLYLDYKGRIWFIHGNNSLSFYEDKKFKEYKYNYLLSNSSIKFKDNSEISSIVIDSLDNMLIKLNSYGFLKINSNGDTCFIKKHTPNQYYLDFNRNFKDFTILPPRPNFDGAYAKEEYSKILNFEGEKYKLKKARNKAIEFGSNLIIDDKFFFCLDNVLYVIKDNKIQSRDFPGKIASIYESGEDIWLGLHNKKGFVSIAKNNIFETKKWILKGYSGTSLIRDNEGNLWMTTSGNGLFYLKGTIFKHLETGQTTSFGKAILANGMIIVATSDGFLFEIDRKNNFRKILNKSFGKIIDLSILNNNLCVYSSSGYYILNNNKVKQINVKRKTEGAISIKLAKHISKNQYLGLSTSGVSYFKEKNKQYVLEGNENKLIFDHLTSMQIIGDSVVYISSSRGLYKLKLNKFGFANLKIIHMRSLFPEFRQRIDELCYNKFDNKLWMRTEKNGLLAWAPNSDELLVIKKKDGLIDNWVTSIAIQDSIILAGTKNGLQKIVVNLKGVSEISTNTKMHGLPTNGIKDIVIRDRNAYITTKKGICFFDIYQKPHKVYPPVYINTFMVNGKIFSPEEKPLLKHDENNISLFFTGISYTSQTNINYKINIGMGDTNWYNLEGNEANVFNCLPGKHTIKVIAQNNDGYWSKKPAKVSFTIKPPYWATWWFRLLLVCSILLIFWLVFQYRMRELKKRNLIRIEEERKRNKLEKERKELESNLSITKQKLVTQQLNPHFLFNTMSSIQYMIINNQKMEAVGLLSKFARMMRQGLEYARVEYASIEQSTEFFKNYIDLKSINLEEKIEVVMDTSKINSAKDCSIPPMLIQPFIENAIIHGLAPKKREMLLKLSFFEIGKSIKCIIEDNGIGRQHSSMLRKKQAESHKSFGVKIINETLEMMNTLHGENYQVKYTDLIDASKKACGTRVEIDFPKFKN